MEPAAQRSLRVATFNILASGYIRRGWYPHSSDDDLDEAIRFSRLVKQLEQLDCDAWLLQEVESNWAARLGSVLDGWSAHYASKQEDRPDGCAIFLRPPARLLRYDASAFEDATLHRPRSGHVYQRLVFEWNNRRLALINTHIRWHPDDAPVEARYGVDQARILVRYWSRICQECDGAIVGGDFNAEPDSEVLKVMRASGFRMAHNRSNAPTANITGNLRPIDFLLYTDSLQASAEPIAPFDASTPMPGPDHASDHVPVSARFQWR